MNIKKFLVGASAGALLLAATAVPAFAASTHPTFGTFVNAGDVPADSKLVININYKVTNDEGYR